MAWKISVWSLVSGAELSGVNVNNVTVRGTAMTTRDLDEPLRTHTKTRNSDQARFEARLEFLAWKSEGTENASYIQLASGSGVDQSADPFSQRVTAADDHEST